MTNYSGTQDGKLLKVVVDSKFPLTNHSAVFSEEWEIYRSEICSPAKQSATKSAVISEQKHVIRVTLAPKIDFVIVSFQHCIISVPKKACWFYRCERFVNI